MGYTTTFSGSFNFDKPLSPSQIEYINMFSETRRMGRSESKLKRMKAAGDGNTRCFELLDKLDLPIGADGEFYCGEGDYGQDHDDSIIDYNSSKQPGLWCQWIVSEDGENLRWNGGEKFYNYVGWLKYMIQHFFQPWGYKVNGEVVWQGEETGDVGVIEVKDNVVTKHEGTTSVPSRKATTPVATNVAKELKTALRGLAIEEIVLDIIKLRNELTNSKKGTAVACKKLDDLIKKYGV